MDRNHLDNTTVLVDCVNSFRTLNAACKRPLNHCAPPPPSTHTYRCVYARYQDVATYPTDAETTARCKEHRTLVHIVVAKTSERIRKRWRNEIISAVPFSLLFFVLLLVSLVPVSLLLLLLVVSFFSFFSFVVVVVVLLLIPFSLYPPPHLPFIEVWERRPFFLAHRLLNQHQTHKASSGKKGF